VVGHQRQRHSEPGEGGLEGFTVQLYADTDMDGVLDAGETEAKTATTSDAGGNYYFSGLSYSARTASAGAATSS